MVSVRFGCLECRKRKKRTLFPELFLSFNLIGLQDQQRRERRWRERCCVLLGFSLQFFFFLQIGSEVSALGEGKGLIRRRFPVGARA